METPQQVKILNKVWEIKKDRNIANEGHVYGSTHYSTQTIFLDPLNSSQHEIEVFFHELLHAIFWTMGCTKIPEMTEKIEEQIIHGLSMGLYSVLKDNDFLK